jgi:hypothetical protein
MFALGAKNDLSCFIGLCKVLRFFFTIVFIILSMKECMTILLLLDMFYNEWKEILVMWELGRIWMGMANYLQDHSLSRSQPSIALWVLMKLTW